MRDSLGVGSDDVVCLVGEVNVARFEGAEDVLDEGEGPVGGAVFDKDLWCNIIFSDEYLVLSQKSRMHTHEGLAYR